MVQALATPVYIRAYLGVTYALIHSASTYVGIDNSWGEALIITRVGIAGLYGIEVFFKEIYDLDTLHDFHDVLKFGGHITNEVLGLVYDYYFSSQT